MLARQKDDPDFIIPANLIESLEFVAKYIARSGTKVRKVFRPIDDSLYITSLAFNYSITY